MGEIQRPVYVSEAIFADEVGMQYGRYGDHVIKSAYQPIFSKSEQWLRPIAVEGLAAVYLRGERIPCKELFRKTPPEDKLFIESMCRALHLRNLHPAGLNKIDLYFNFDPSSHDRLEPSVREIRYMAKRLTDMHINPRNLVCEVTESAALDDDVLLELVREMRRHGIRLAIDDFGTGQSGWERFELIEPDVVKIDSRWFQRLVAEPGAIDLLTRLVGKFHEFDIPVLVEGVETPLHLQSALDAGVERFQGYLFGRPALAGSQFNEHPVSLASLLGAAPLYSLLQAEQQRRMYF
ncbi:MAG: EAL domain-containing protein [Rhizobiaceae bacterium]